jgi:hypothetical protein
VGNKPAKREVGSIDSDAMETNDGANDDYVGSEAFEMKRVMSPCCRIGTWSQLHTTYSLPRVPRHEREGWKKVMRRREKLQADKKYLVDAPCKK